MQSHPRIIASVGEAFSSQFAAQNYYSGTVNPFMPTVPTFAVRETASLGNPSETIVLSEHYRL